MEKELNQEILDDIIILTNQDGQDVEFYNEAIITHEGLNYVVLKPVNEIEGIAEDEVLIFEFINENEEGQFYLVENEQLADEIFAKYLVLLDENDQVDEV